MSDLREQTMWFGACRGIRFEINRFKSFDPDAYTHGWTFYLHLATEQFGDHAKDLYTKIYYTAFGTPIEIYEGPLVNLDWHGGLTWSSNESSPGRPFSVFKFGCDFQHLWDMHKDYDLDYVRQEVEACVDSLFKMYPDLITEDKLWENFRSNFPGEKAGDDRHFDISGKPIERPT